MPPKEENKKQFESTSTRALLTDMAHDSNIRTNEKSKKLQKVYEARLEDLEYDIKETLTEDKEALSAVRQDQLTRLLTLIRRRSAIQSATADSHATLISAYDGASKELRRAIKYRRDEIQENLDSARAAGAEQEGQEENEASSA